MKRLFSMLPALLLVCQASVAQTYKLTWGDEMKLKKGTADLDIISADKSGLFLAEQRKQTSFFAGSSASSYKLYKLDNNFSEVFDKEYKKELKGLDFQSFQPLNNELYMFATDYIRKERAFKVYGARIDKSSGDLVGDFEELGSYDLESKKDDYEMKVTPVQNGSAFLMVSNVSGKDRVSIGVSLLDKNLKRKESTVINLSFDPSLYQLEDVQYTRNNKIILLGKEYEEAVIKKKKKRLVFKQYVMAIYDADGKKLNDIRLDAENRFVISGKLIEQPSGELLLAGFYSNAARKDDLNGFFINKVNPETGELLLSSYKEINSGMLGKAYADANDEDDEMRDSKKQLQKSKNADDDDDDFPNRFVIKSVDINPVDNSILITSEVSQYSFSTYTSSSYNYTTRSWTYTTTYVHRFTNQDILIINANKDGDIKWLNDLPKSQVEEVRTTSQGYNWSMTYDRGGYFATAGGMPFYSSYISMINNNKLILVMNDHTSNNVNPGYGDRVKTVYNFRKKSNAYGITIDLSTGKMTRTSIASNDDETILMPRHAMAVGNELYIPSWRQHLMAKTELKFAKISVK